MEKFISTVLGCRYLSKHVVFKTLYLPIIFGIITSFWAMASIVLLINQHMCKEIIINGIIVTYLAFFVPTTYDFISGIKQKKGYLLLPWMQMKLLDCGLSIAVLILVSVVPFDYVYKEVTVIAIIALVISLILLRYAWGLYKSMPAEDADEEVPNIEKPPGYEEAVLDTI